MSFSTTLHSFGTRHEKIFSLFIQGVIVISMVDFSIETLPDLSPATQDILDCLEVIGVTIFTIEYALRLYFSRKRFQFIFSFFGIIDLIAILPFYLSLGLDLRSIRAFRLLRIFRILKLARYSAAMNRFHRALLIAKEELILFLAITGILIFFSAVGIYYFERDAQPEQFASVFHSLWWSVVTLTTVGYGDIYPITAGGRLFTFCVLLIGLGIVAIPTGIVAAALQQAREEIRNASAESPK